MRACRSVLLAFLVLIGCATGGVALAAEPSAQDFLDAIHAAYKGKDAKGIELSRRGATARCFAPSLARLIEPMQERGRSGVPTLGSDPFIDAQDFEISAVAITVRQQGPDKAVGTVKFRNIDQNITVTLDLVKLKNGWRIDDIRTSNGSLRALFKKR